MQDETTAEDALPEEDASSESASEENVDETPSLAEDAAKIQANASEVTVEDVWPESAEPEAPSDESISEAGRIKAAEAALRAPSEPEAPSEEAAPVAEAVESSAETEVAEGEDSTDEDVDERPVLIVEPPDDGVKRRWYAIHAHSGQEGNVQAALKVKAEQMGLSDSITNIFVPMEEVAEYKSGEKRLSKRKFFPGYVLVQLPEHPEKNADLWHLIKDTPGVTGFIGSRTEPVPLEDSEVISLAEEMRGERERPRPKVAFEVAERVKIIDGAFANFMGNIGEINEERAKMKVLIEIFERQTSVEVEFWQVEKL